VSTELEFKISTGLKSIIGRELITEEHTAIFELVKNAYDAGASKVKIIFENVKSEEWEKLSRVIITDDGDGMSLSDIKEKWLFVGYSEKKIDENMDDYRDKIVNRKRIFAGSKGIGRFSADRLGPRLNLYTKKANEDKIHMLEMDWAEFEKDQKKPFQTIFVKHSPLHELPSEILMSLPEDSRKLRKGTILEISPLRDSWDRSRLLKLKRYLQRLVNPTQISDNQEFSIEIIAKEFAEEDKEEKVQKEHKDVNGVIKNIVLEKLGIKTTQIICNISEKKIVTELIDKDEFVFKLTEENTYKGLDNISIHVFYLNKEAKTEFTKTMGLQPVRFGSIFLYKNGFRIHPYGEEGDDWLGLERRKTQGYARTLSNREAMGRIEVNGLQPKFKEVSSRAGGLVRTKQVELLVDLFYDKVLRRLEKYVVEGIDWDMPPEKKRKSDEEIKRDSISLIAKIVGQVDDPNKNLIFNPDLLSIFKRREIENLPEVIKNVEELLNYVKTDSKKEAIREQIKSLRKIAKNLTAGLKIQDEELEIKKKEILFLKKSLAPDKKIIEDYHHTIRIATGYIDTYVKEINKKIRSHAKMEQIIPLIDLISAQNQKVKSLVSLVSKSNFNLQTKDVNKDIIEYIRQYLQDILRESVKRIRYSFQNDNLTFVTRFKPLEISMILDNFVSNSSKADASLIKIRFETIGKKLKILIGDNGHGIKPSIEQHLFERGFTTTDGSGLGLNHIKSTLEQNGWNVRFVGNNHENMGNGACFEVVIS
jgi:signal transduction histidine kinase